MPVGYQNPVPCADCTENAQLDSASIKASLSACECRAGHCRAKQWCGRRDLSPHGPIKPCGFSCRLRLSQPRRGAFGGATSSLRSGLSLHLPPEDPELRCCSSSLYTFPAECLSGLGSGLPFQVSPNLSSSSSPVSQASTQVVLANRTGIKARGERDVAECGEDFVQRMWPR
jgi:hypothetical protein